MKTSKIILATLLCCICALTACRKYENGPRITVISKNARVQNNWEVDFISFGNFLVNTDYEDLNWEIMDNDSIAITYNDGTSNKVISGKWELSFSKTVFEWALSDFSAHPEFPMDSTVQLDISKLKQDEFWFYDNNNYLVRLKPKG